MPLCHSPVHHSPLRLFAPIHPPLRSAWKVGGKCTERAEKAVTFAATTAALLRAPSEETSGCRQSRRTLMPKEMGTMNNKLWGWRFTYSVVLIICSALSAAKAKSQEPLSEMYHRSWTVREGAPNNIEDATQGGDGFIWLTTDDGLYRFDGVKFERYRPPNGSQLLSQRLASITSSRDGSIWFSYMAGGVTRITGNKITTFTEKNGLRPGHTGTLAEDLDGRVWVAGSGGMQYIRDDHVTQVSGTHGEGVGYTEQIAIDHDGNLWITPWRRGVFVLRRGTSEFIEVAKDFYYGCSPAHKAGVLCRIEVGPMVHFTLTDGKITSDPLVVSSSRVYDQLAAKDGTIWMGTERDGVQRFRADSDSLLPSGHSDVESFGRAEGLSGRKAFTLFGDREGSVWVATDRGLDQFRPVPFHQVELDTSLESLPSSGKGSTFLIGTERLVDMTSGVPVPLDKNYEIGGIRCIFRSDDGTIWVGGRGLGQYRDGRIRPIALPEGLQGPAPVITDIVEDSEHDVWVAISANGLYRLSSQGWSKRGGYVGLPDVAPLASLRDSRGNVWFGFRKDVLIRSNSGKVNRFDASTGLDIGDIKAIHENAEELWIGGEKGVAVGRDGTFRAVTFAHSQAILGVTGMVFLPEGDLWINSASGIFRISSEQISLGRSNASHALEWTRYDYLDGVNGITLAITVPSVAVSADGRLYLATNWGLQWVDPRQISTNKLIPPVWITDVRTPQQDFVPDGKVLRLSADPKTLTITYTAPSLLIPERVRFRYRLLGFDNNWTDAGNFRVASYTKIPPGKYTFQVIACNDAGVWSTVGASLAISVAPTIFETIWFKLLLLVLLLALTFVSFKIRLARIHHRIAVQMFEVLSERQRIARDLHDTFLQSVQMIFFKVAIAAKKLPADDPVRPVLEEMMMQSDQIMLDGRRLISNLQAQEESSGSLSMTLRAVINELEAVYPSMQWTVAIEGTDRLLNPFVQQELCVIGREALTNACRHAGADHIWLHLQVEPDCLRLIVRDDGNGIEQDVIAKGYRVGHWGLQNMRERADRVGARFTLKSSKTKGTAVEVAVSASVAYKGHLGGVRGKLRKFWGNTIRA
jgi:signal transduction histidine kinase/ligand-binding sensor domain-containing protein